MRHWLRVALQFGTLACVANAQRSVEFVDAAAFPETTVDQHGSPFTITGLSGVTHLGKSRYCAVMDNSDKVVLFDLTLNDDGTIVGVAGVFGLTLGASGDHEAIAVSGKNQVFIADESGMTLREFSLVDGSLLRELSVPAVYGNRRNNLGLESLSIETGIAWTANEEALTVDGDRSTPDAGTVVRLLRERVADGVAFEQFAYVVEPMHGARIPGGDPGQSGLSELVGLPDGGLLALERSLALANPFFLSRIFEVNLDGATDVSGFGSLEGGGFTPAGKTLLYSGGQANLEGLCLGTALNAGGHALVGVVDDGDPLSTNTVVVFRLEGLDACPADLDGDGDTDAEDFFSYLDAFAAGDVETCDIDADQDCDAEDFFGYLDLFAAGC